MHSYDLRGHCQFLGGGDAADALVRAVIVVSPEPLRGVVLGQLGGMRGLIASVT